MVVVGGGESPPQGEAPQSLQEVTGGESRELRRMSDIIKTQRSFATKALHQPTHRFDHLYRIIRQREWIERALEGVLANKGAHTPGIDGLTEEDLATESARLIL